MGQMKQANPHVRSLLKGAFFLLSLVLIGWLIRESDLNHMLTKNWIDHEIKGQGWIGEAIFLLIGVCFAAIGMPRQIVSFMGGYAFGLSFGMGLAWLATILGCIISFWYARVVGQKVIMKWAPRRLKKIDAFLCRAPFTMSLIIRLLPVGSNGITNLAAGISNISAIRFFSGSAIGFLPQTAIFAMVGSGSSISSEMQIMISIILFVISGAAGVVLYRKYGKDVSVEEQSQGNDNQETQT